MKQFASDHSDELFGTESTTVKYVMQEIKRDPKENPQRKDYVYPTEYAKTDEYATILQDVSAEYDREANIRDGKLQPGKGPDYPGELGPQDLSGIIENTAPRPAAPEAQEALGKAAAESDDNYSSEEEEDAPTLDTPVSPLGKHASAEDESEEALGDDGETEARGEEAEEEEEEEEEEEAEEEAEEEEEEEEEATRHLSTEGLEDDE